MTGANYMGGRRNAAKAKSRDKTGKIQKNFFGRKKLNLLSKGLSVHSCLDAPGFGIQQSTTTAKASFNFGHAKKLKSQQEAENMAHFSSGDDGSSSTLFASKEGIKISISTGKPLSPTTSKATIGAKSSPRLMPTKSKLLQQLEIFEPFSSDGAISRILATPDLAGLCSSKKRSCLESPQSPSVSSVSDPHIAYEEEDILDFDSESQQLSQLETSFQSSGRDPEVDSLATSEQSHFSKSSNKSTGSKSRTVFESYSASRSQSLYPDPLGHYSDLEDFESLDWSPLEGLSSSKPELYRPCSIDGLPTPLPSGSHMSRNWIPPPDDEGWLGIRDSTLDFSQLQPRRSPPKVTMAAEWEEINLFDYSDPWAEIGVMLGLQHNVEHLLTQHQSPHMHSKVQEHKATWESDLPPSDIFLEDSFDGSMEDSLYAQSSLPVAESSEVMEVASILGRGPSSSSQDEGASELVFVDNDGFQQSQLDGFSPDRIATGVMDSGLSLDGDISFNSGAGHGAIGADPPLRLEPEDALLGLELGSGYIRDQIERHPHSIHEQVNRNAGDAVLSYLLPQSAVSPHNNQAELGLRAHDASWYGGNSDQKGDNMACVLTGGEDSAEFVKTTSSSILAVPELLQFEGIYHGPCLLSEESDVE